MPIFDHLRLHVMTHASAWLRTGLRPRYCRFKLFIAAGIIRALDNCRYLLGRVCTYRVKLIIFIAKAQRVHRILFWESQYWNWADVNLFREMPRFEAKERMKAFPVFWGKIYDRYIKLMKIRRYGPSFWETFDHGFDPTWLPGLQDFLSRPVIYFYWMLRRDDTVPFTFFLQT